MVLVQKEPSKIYMRQEPYTDYSAMQGPCPTGYHVPSSDEWSLLCGILTSTFGMASNATTAGTYLKLPLAGSRVYSTGAVSSGEGMYWSSTSSNGYSYALYANSLNPQLGLRRSYGCSIRCFSDTPVAPTSARNILYDGSSIASGAGVFWDSVNGLISVSGDGITWYTIMDKNLGATTVYNQGNTLTDANCGYFYQWGNNYGFPHSGTVTTSTTLVDASSYGPGNYYSGNIFIISNNSLNDRSSVRNDNLWGGETGVITGGGDTEVKAVYLGTTKVRPEPQYLCFIAVTAPSTVKLTKTGTPATVSLETSIDGITWNSYAINDTITLSNIGDKVFFRNTSETDTQFSLGTSNYYKFSLSGTLDCSGDVSYLLNKNSTTAVSNYCFGYLFQGCSQLKSAPKLPATTLSQQCYTFMFSGSGIVKPPKLPATILATSCYNSMFYNCKSLAGLPELPATGTLPTRCYNEMFRNCIKIMMSKTQGGAYQTEYRIPTTGTATEGTYSLYAMFSGTLGPMDGADVTTNTTYYTANTVV